ncbi:hypothetical protein DL96DRAFT_1615474 [Flagelloscypha sp. PMI_526]|nr:hypothetical protein DL96DRAFT_1615474 [Flagelloscypha sp. PMI_526]
MSPTSIEIQSKLKLSVSDLLLALVLLSPPTLPKASRSNAPEDATNDPNDQPANFLVPSTVYTAPTAPPATIDNILSMPHRTDLPRHQIDKVLPTHEASQTAQKFFPHLNDFNIIDFIKVHEWTSVFAKPWTRPDFWGSQTRRVIDNEACVDIAVTQNVVEPVVACLEVFLAPFLEDLNNHCKRFFGDNSFYSLQVRHETGFPKDPEITENRNGRLDVIITLEPSVDGLAVKNLVWTSHTEFLDKINNALAALAKIGNKLPGIVLHIFEDKKPGVLNPDAFDPKYNQKALNGQFRWDTQEYVNVRTILPQLKRYAFELQCPYVTVSDYFSFYMMSIPPEAVDSEYVDKVLTLKTATLAAILINAERQQDRTVPRKIVFCAVLRRLQDIGVLTGQINLNMTMYKFPEYKESKKAKDDDPDDDDDFVKKKT